MVAPQEQRDGRNPQTGKTIQIAKNVVKFKGAIRRCSKLIVSFKPIIIKTLWKFFFIFKRFYLCFLLFILKFIKIIDYDFRKINKGQLLIIL
jgi:hypothetical protein